MATAGAPRTDLGFFGLRPRSLSSFSRMVGLAEAGRPLAGGSPSIARSDIQGIAGLCVLVGWLSLEQNPSSCLAGVGASSGPDKPLRKAERHQYKVRPNPSIERTSTGLARKAPQVHVPLRGPIRFRRAHVKR
jgi:hypothetical protein